MNSSESTIPSNGDASQPTTPAQSLTRRKFLRSGVVAGSSLYLATSKNTHAQGASDDINVALVGCGAQGEALRNALQRETERLGVRFVAVCDIWEFNRGKMARLLEKFGHTAEEYVDIEDMLAKQSNIDVCLIATPDFVHAPHTIAALETSNIKGVYCEKMMSNTIEAARSMVQAQQRTGKLLQIGHQRRSNPRYLNVRNNLIHGNRALGRVTHAYAQWNRAVSDPISAPDRYALDQATLSKYGYSNMMEFRNWRWFRKFGGGPISDLGAHQIDLFNWIYGTTPRSVIASGGRDFYKEFEFEDNVIAVYEFDTPEGTSRALYQVLTTTSSQGFYEKFMGVDGTIAISEVPTVNQAYREARAPSWEGFAEQGFIRKLDGVEAVHHKFWQQPKPWYRPSRWLDTGKVVDVRVSKPLEQWELAVDLPLPAHEPHLENFLTVVRNGGKQTDLNCPVEEAYRTCVTVLKIEEAMNSGSRYDFKPEDFQV